MGRLLVACVGILFLTVESSGEEYRVVEDFSIGAPIAGGVPPNWHASQRDVLMSSVKDDGQGRGNLVLSVDTQGGNTTIAKRFNYRVQQFPLLRWRWRVRALPVGGREDQRQTGDSGAGIYVIFKGKLRLNRMIKYVWSSSLPEGTLTESPHNGRGKIIVVRSGSQDMGTWKNESANILDDYRRAFGESDPPEVEAIAIMSDADNTQSRAQADYDDLVVSTQ